MPTTVSDEKLIKAKVQAALQDWGRWRRQGVGLGYTTSSMYDKDDIDVFDDEKCGEINRAWLQLKKYHPWHAELLDNYYTQGMNISDLAKKNNTYWRNIRENLDKAEWAIFRSTASL